MEIKSEIDHLLARVCFAEIVSASVSDAGTALYCEAHDNDMPKFLVPRKTGAHRIAGNHTFVLNLLINY